MPEFVLNQLPQEPSFLESPVVDMYGQFNNYEELDVIVDTEFDDLDLDELQF